MEHLLSDQVNIILKQYKNLFHILNVLRYLDDTRTRKEYFFSHETINAETLKPIQQFYIIMQPQNLTQKEVKLLIQ